MPGQVHFEDFLGIQQKQWSAQYTNIYISCIHVTRLVGEEWDHFKSGPEAKKFTRT